MRIIKIGDLGVYDEAKKVLEAGGIVMHPTETCYGLAVDVMNEGAYRKLYEIKEMGFDKPVSVMVANLEMAMRFADFNNLALDLAGKHWPGALSIIVKRGQGLPDFFLEGIAGVSFRVSSDEFSARLAEEFASPYSTTSANITGHPQMYFPDFENYGEFLSKIDLIVDGGVIAAEKPSTIVDVSDGEFKILREGRLDLSECS